MSEQLMNTSLNKKNMGDILVSSGRLRETDVQHITQYQDMNNLPFGQAALELKLLDQGDIDFALAKQFDYSYLDANEARFNSELIAAYKPFSKIGEQLRNVRSQLVMRWFNKDDIRKVISIISADNGDGKSFIASNIAVMFAQQGYRTLLIDADMRNPSQDQIFNVNNKQGLASLISGRAGYEVICDVNEIEGLSVLPSGPQPPNAQELLGKLAFKELLQFAATNFDVVIVDTPNILSNSDAEVVATQVGASVMVVRKNVTSSKSISQIKQRLEDNGVSLIGSIVNEY